MVQGTPYYEYQRKIQGEEIPYYEPWIGEEELSQVTEVIRTGWVSEGAKTRAFENAIADRFGVEHALAVSNCTAALIISMKALGIGPGDEVIAPAFTFIASVSAIKLAGATPVLVDVDRRTFNIDAALVERSITPRTKAVIPVHLYGQAADMDAILSIARRHDLLVIEDAAQGMGVKFEGKPVGSFGDTGCLSFFADKSVTLGEGGIVLTNSEDTARELLMLKNDGRLERGMYYHDRIGYNFRITELQAALGLAQLAKVDAIIERKRRNLDLYRELLADVEGVELPYQDPRSFSVPHRVNILVDDPEGLEKAMAEDGIGCRRFFYPIHKQPAFNLPLSFPVAELLYERGFSLPSSPLLSEDQIHFICACLKANLARGRRFIPVEEKIARP